MHKNGRRQLEDKYEAAHGRNAMWRTRLRPTTAGRLWLLSDMVGLRTLQECGIIAVGWYRSACQDWRTWWSTGWLCRIWPVLQGPAKRKLLSYLVMHEETQNPKMRPVVRHVVLGEVRGDRTFRTFIGAYKTDYTCTAETIQDFRRPYVQMVDDNAYPKVRASLRLEQEDYLNVFDHLGRPETPWTPQFKTLPGGGSGQVAKVVYIHRDTGEVFEGRPPIC